jgi:hypothetical protein
VIYLASKQDTVAYGMRIERYTMLERYSIVEAGFPYNSDTEKRVSHLRPGSEFGGTDRQDQAESVSYIHIAVFNMR